MFRLGHGRSLVQHPGDLLQRRGRRLERVVELRQVLERVEEALEVEQEGDQHPDLHAPVDDPEPAVEQHGPDREVADQADAGRVDRDQARGTQAGGRVVGVEFAKDLLVPALPAERLDRPDTAKCLHKMHDDLRDRLSGPAVCLAGLAPEPGGQPGQRAEAGQHDESQRPVEQQHPGTDQQQRQDRGHQRVKALVEQVGDRVDVRDLPGDDPAGGVALVERHGQQQEVREQAAPELGHHVGAEPAHRGNVGPGGGGLHDDRNGERGEDDGQRASDRG